MHFAKPHWKSATRYAHDNVLPAAAMPYIPNLVQDIINSALPGKPHFRFIKTELYFRRAKAMELAFGEGDFHREIVARQSGL